ncbi:MAG: twin-arginine translocation signal domain-containing protein [Anaerolineales bacterium]|nr:twin-arginine translocation signal domain-containing protein [Anaerolineales bacterium]
MTSFIPGPRGRRLNRRAFLKLGALAGVAAAVGLPDLGLRIGSALPLAGYAVTRFDAFPQRPPPGFDLLRVPAYLAAAYIRNDALLPLDGQRGRAHDPEGAFTQPARYLAGALLGAGPGAARRWQQLWTQPPGAAWPNNARLVLAAALLRRGYSPNDTHAGHLAQAETDLLLAGRPERLPDADRDLLAHLPAGPLIYALEALDGLDPAALPLEGAPLIEYDWVIPADSLRPAEARAYVAAQALPAGVVLDSPPHGPFPARLIPLMPLPERAQAQVAAIWARLRWLAAA